MSSRPVMPMTICAGNSATVEVMLAARASMPVNISAGSVMNEPPPASAFCAPAQRPRRRHERDPGVRHQARLRLQTRTRLKRMSRGRGACSAISVSRSNPTGAPSTTRQRPRDHHPVGAMRAAQHQRRERIVRAGKARLVEREQREVGLPPDLDLADVVAPEAARRALASPSAAHRVGDRRGAIAQPADHQGVAHAPPSCWRNRWRPSRRRRGRPASAGPLQFAGRGKCPRPAPCWRPRNGRPRRPPCRAARSLASLKWMPCASQVRFDIQPVSSSRSTGRTP